MPEVTKKLFSVSFDGKPSVSLPLNLLQTSIYPVVLIQAERLRTVGSCFAISNHGLCMTARHVIDEVPLAEGLSEDGLPMPDGQLGILYLAPPEGPDDGKSDLFGGFVPMRRVFIAPALDIAVMHLNLPVMNETGEPLHCPALRLRLRPPSVGDRSFTLGYEKGVWSRSDDGVQTISQTFTASEGFVDELHPQGRDKVMLPFPCFQTSAPFHSGMSGGPVMSEDGFVVGIVSTGFEVGAGEQAISYASLVAPSMFIKIEAALDDGTLGQRFLWDFIEGGAVSGDTEGVTITRSHSRLSIDVNDPPESARS